MYLIIKEKFMIKLSKMCEMTYPYTHIVLYDGSNFTARLDCPILFDGKSKDIDLTLYGSYEIIYSAGAADQPCGVLYWIKNNDY